MKHFFKHIKNKIVYVQKNKFHSFVQIITQQLQQI